MQRIDGLTAAIARPAPGPLSGTPGYFTGGDPAVPLAPTTVTPDWLNAIQEELVGVIIGAGLDLSKADNGQLLTAIRTLITSGGVSFATDDEAIAGMLANKAVSPRAAAALVTKRIAAIVNNAPASLATLAGLATAISNNPNFGAETATALGARALAARQITGGGLAIGGGDLANDQVITVPAASGIELNAAADATKALTPAAYGAAGGGDGSSGWVPLPGGNMLQWGSIQVIGGNASNRDFTIAFPKPFLNVCGSIVGNTDPQGGGSSTQPCVVEFNAPTIAGVTGRIDSTESNRKISTRVLRWQAIGR